MVFSVSSCVFYILFSHFYLLCKHFYFFPTFLLIETKKLLYFSLFSPEQLESLFSNLSATRLMIKTKSYDPLCIILGTSQGLALFHANQTFFLS